MNNKSFKNIYTNLALYLIKKLPHASNNSDLELVLACYHKFLNTEKQKITFPVTSEDEIFKLLKINNSRIAADLGNLSLRILKHGAVVFGFLYQNYNLSKM